jgi:lysyl-tRNA synthetase, class II
MSEIPYVFDEPQSAASLHAEFDESVEDGTSTAHKVCVAGRIMLRRGQGKLAFATLADATGRIQLFAPANATENFEGFTDLKIGDWVGVHGTIMKTRKGELSVHVDQWQILAPTMRGFPDKWHGLSDQDIRYRQRYVDLWVTDESRATLTLRSNLVSFMRRWLEDRGYMEVQTPMLQSEAGGAVARPFKTHHSALGIDMYLRIAPELYLKRLLVGGFTKIFEIGSNFRNEGISPRHNPEFTMLELYSAYSDYNLGMELVESLVSEAAVKLTGSMKIEHGGRSLDLSPPWPRKTLMSLVSEAVGQSVDLSTSVEELRRLAESKDVHIDEASGAGEIIFELYERLVEANIWEPTFVVDMPKAVSPLSRDHRSEPGLVEHCDAVVAGRELAPIYSELTDAAEQRARFEDQAAKRAAGDDEAMTVDEDFLRALEYGMPPAAGLGLGIDRFAMLLSDSTNIRDVVMFPTLRPEQS